MKGLPFFGFSWMEFVISIPSPIFLISSCKPNGKENTCLQTIQSQNTGCFFYFSMTYV